MSLQNVHANCCPIKPFKKAIANFINQSIAVKFSAYDIQTKVNNELMLQNEINSLGGENIKQAKGITSADMIVRRR